MYKNVLAENLMFQEALFKTIDSSDCATINDIDFYQLEPRGENKDELYVITRDVDNNVVNSKNIKKCYGMCSFFDIMNKKWKLVKF